MAYTKVIGFFTDPAAVDKTKAALIRAKLADEGTMWTEPESLSQDLHPPRPEPGLLHRLKDFIAGEDKAATSGADLGRTALVVTVRDQLSGSVRDIMCHTAAGDGPADVAVRFARDPHIERQSEQREVLRSATGAARELDS